MPSGPQPCSSSPISVRCGSADSVVLPVPDRPKNSAESPCGPTLAEQCIGTTFSRRQIEIERGEHRLLHFAGIRGAADQHDLAGEIDRHHGVGAFAPAVPLGVGPERRQVDDGEFGDEFGELVALGADQQLPDEQRVPGVFGEHAGLDPVFRIGAAVEILREQFLAFGVRLEIGEQIVEILLRHFAVAVPPHRILGERIDDGVLVLRRAAGVVAGLGAERAAFDQRGFAGRDRMLVERRFGQIPVDRGEVLKAEFVGAIGTVPHTRFLHANSSPTRGPLRRTLAGLSRSLQP